MMDTKKIAAFYTSGAQAFEEAVKVLDTLSLNKNFELRNNYVCIYHSAESLMKNTHEIFVREFPENFKACMDCKDFDIEAFYKLIDEHPEILINCEDKFFELVKQHVENNVGGLTHTLMFNWNWVSIYGILSSNTVKNFVQETKSSAFEKMVLAIARHIDLIQDQRQQMAILFFKNAVGFDYYDFKNRIIDNLQKNQSFEPWINTAIETLKKGEV